jgi:hypothetical protein
VLHLNIISSKEVKVLTCLIDLFTQIVCLYHIKLKSLSNGWFSYLQQELPILQSIIIYLVICHPVMLCQGTFEASQEKKNPFPLLKPLTAKICNLCDA